MFTRWIFLIVAGCVSEKASADGPTCVQPLTQFAACVENATDLIISETLPILQIIEQCLNSSDCNGMDDEETSDRPQPQGMFRSVNPARLWLCTDNATEEGRISTERCVLERMPQWNDTKKHQGKAASLIKQPFDYIKKKKDRLKNLCATNESRNNASDCIQSAMKDFKSPSSKEVDQAMKKLCSAETTCRNELSKDCQDRLDHVNQVGCACFRETSTVTRDRFLDCLNSPMLNALRRFVDASPYFSKPISKEFCNAFDPCTASGGKNTSKTGRQGGFIGKMVDAGKKLMNSFSS